MVLPVWRPLLDQPNHGIHRLLRIHDGRSPEQQRKLVTNPWQTVGIIPAGETANIDQTQANLHSTRSRWTPTAAVPW